MRENRILKASIHHIVLCNGAILCRRVYRENGKKKYGWYNINDNSLWEISLKTNMGEQKQEGI